MKYRPLGKTGIMVSEVGLGSEAFVRADEKTAMQIYDFAIESGVNYFDLYNSEPHVRDNLGKAMQGRREKFIVQGQIGSAWEDGQYVRTREISKVKEACEDMFTRLKTDYIDVGMIHYCDEQKDFDLIMNGEFAPYVKELKAQGRIKAIGLGTHNPSIALQAAKTGWIEVILISMNPAYDMLPPNEDVDVLFEKETFNTPLTNLDPAREELYSYCEANGIALTVMKPYAGGALLKAEESPFGVAMTVPQCLHYCLTRPAVASVCCGAHTVEELKEAVAYSDLSESEKEYATTLANAPAHGFHDKCMYCGHCAPCTVGIDIALVNKFADLCKSQGEIPETVREHYAVLEAKASDCIGCGACEYNCPFGVHIIEHMAETAELFGC